MSLTALLCSGIKITRAILGFFAPKGWYCSDGVKFGVEEDQLFHAKFHPHQCTDGDVGPQKVKNLRDFFIISEYKRFAETHPSCDFDRIIGLMGCFTIGNCNMLKFGGIC